MKWGILASGTIAAKFAKTVTSGQQHLGRPSGRPFVQNIVQFSFSAQQRVAKHRSKRPGKCMKYRFSNPTVSVF